MANYRMIDVGECLVNTVGQWNEHVFGVLFYCSVIYYLESTNLGQDGSLGLECGVLAQSDLSLRSELGLSLDVLVELGGSLSSLDRQSLDELLALPADLGSHVAENAELSLGLQAQGLGSLGDSHLLLLVIRSGDTVEHLHALKSGLTSGSLMGEHATDSSPENHRRSSVVKRASSGIGSGGLHSELLILQLVSEQGSGDVDALASDDSLKRNG